MIKDAMRKALVSNKFLLTPLKISLHYKKKSVVSDSSQPKIYKALKRF